VIFAADKVRLVVPCPETMVVAEAMPVPEIYHPLLFAGTAPLVVIVYALRTPDAAVAEIAIGERMSVPVTVLAFVLESVSVFVPCPELIVVVGVIPVPEIYHPLQFDGAAVARVTVDALATPAVGEIVTAANGSAGLIEESVPISNDSMKYRVVASGVIVVQAGTVNVLLVLLVICRY
jgi:hypothetical protein